MRAAAPATLLAVALLATACGTRGYADFDPNARFDTFRTFAWVSDTPGLIEAESGEVSTVDPLLDRRIRATIEDVLATKGYRVLPELEGADFALAYSVGTREKIDVSSSPSYSVGYGSGWGGRYGGWYAGTSTSVRSYTEGTLAIDVFDVKSREAVWHGWASKRLSPSADRQKVVDEVVLAILKKFPPER